MASQDFCLQQFLRQVVRNKKKWMKNRKIKKHLDNNQFSWIKIVKNQQSRTAQRYKFAAKAVEAVFSMQVCIPFR